MQRSTVLVLAIMLVLAACSTAAPSGGAAGAPDPSRVPSPTATSPVATPDASDPPDGPAGPTARPSASEGPTTTRPPFDRPWATATLTDVTTGERFRIADLVASHPVVFVEAMAIWCTKCRAQQVEFTTALADLDPADVAYVVLTIDPSETAEALARYRAERGFAGTYAVAGREVSAALEADFGPTVINPPTVPIVIVGPDGPVRFRTGHHPAGEIAALVGTLIADAADSAG